MQTPEIESPEQLAEYIKGRIVKGEPLTTEERSSWELYCKVKGWTLKLKKDVEVTEEQDAEAIKRALKRAQTRAKKLGEALTEHDQGKWEV